MAGGAQAVPASSGPPPGVTLTPLPPESPATPPAAAGPPPGVTLTPLAASAPSTPPAASGSPALTSNPKGEGTYSMVDNSGQTLQIPYSQVQGAASNGARFQSKQALQQYARDHAADPVNEDAADHYIDGLSWYNPVRMGRDVIAGFGTGALKTATGLDRAPKGHGEGGKLEQDAQLAAATPTKGVVQEGAEAAENVGEWFSGEELLGMLGKTGEAMSLPEKLKSVTGLAQTIEKYPLVGKLLKIGSGAVKQGTIGAAQTYAKTGGDAGAAGEAGLLTAAIAPAAEGIASRIANRSAAAAVPSGAERYANEARATVEPQLRTAQAAMDAQREFPEAAATAPGGPASSQGVYDATATPTAQPVPHQPHSAADLLQDSTPALPGGSDTDLATRNQVGPTRTQGSVEYDEGRDLPGGQGQAALPGRGSAATGSSAAASAAATQTTSFDVDHVLNTIHDMNGAKDRLVQVASPMYDVIDKVTNGDFRTLNDQVSAAQKAVYKSAAGTPERDAAETLYAQRQQQMSDLIDSTRGKVSPEIVSAAKGAFRQSYALKDFATIWDKNLEGVPGNTKVSAAQRGINGKGLMNDLTKAVNKKGRPYIESVLGPGRLDNLEEIARANDTIPKKVEFTQAVRNVAKNMSHAAFLGGSIGETAGGSFHAGAAIGAGLMGATYLPEVLKAVSMNPRIGQQLTYAIKAGAKPETYGPIIARLIQASQAEDGQPGADQPPEAALPPKATADPQLTYDIGPQQGKPISGLIQRGNIDVNHRPQIKNADGSSSTIFSMTVPVGKDGHSLPWDSPNITGYALVPSIADGKFLTPNGAKPAEGDKGAMRRLEGATTANYDKTRQHLGIFSSDKDAEAYTGTSHAWGNDGTARKVYMPSS